jgi:multiple sugar transport system permease protein
MNVTVASLPAEQSLLAQRRAAARRRRVAWATLEWGAILLVLFIILFPIGWMVMTAFKGPADVFSLSVIFQPTFDNFRKIFGPEWHLGSEVLNSLIIAGCTVAIAIPVAVCAAYAFSRLPLFGRRTLFQYLLITQFIPGVVVVLPFYLLFRTLGLLDTYTSLIVVNLSSVVPYTIWTIKGFIDAIPRDTEEAALLDGAPRLRLIWDIVVPMARPGILTAAIFAFMLTWNEFLFALILSRRHTMPLSIGLIGFRTERGDLWELIAATGIIITIPMFFLAMAVQRHFTKGMNLGAVR